MGEKTKNILDMILRAIALILVITGFCFLAVDIVNVESGHYHYSKFCSYEVYCFVAAATLAQLSKIFSGAP